MSGSDIASTTGTPSDQREAALPERLGAIRERIAAAAERSGRPAESVTLLAVTKTLPVGLIQAAYGLGLRDFGENRVQEAEEKRGALAMPEARWELIGHLQKNKIKKAVALFGRVQSVDSLELARALDTHASKSGLVLPVLLEVNVAGEASKFGFTPDTVIEAARAMAQFAALRPEGLMTVAPIAGDVEVLRVVFRQLRALAEAARDAAPVGTDGGWRVLSMGMSDDFETAIEEGSTLVRLGRALFGPRPPAAPKSSGAE